MPIHREDPHALSDHAVQSDHRVQAFLAAQDELRAAARRLTLDVNEAHLLVHRVLLCALTHREGRETKALLDDLERIAVASTLH